MEAGEGSGRSRLRGEGAVNLAVNHRVKARSAGRGIRPVANAALTVGAGQRLFKRGEPGEGGPPELDRQTGVEQL